MECICNTGLTGSTGVLICSCVDHFRFLFSVRKTQRAKMDVSYLTADHMGFHKATEAQSIMNHIKMIHH